MPDKDRIAQEPVRQSNTHVAKLSFGKLQLVDHGEEIPIVVLIPQGKPSDDFVLWLDGDGKSAVLKDDGSVVHELMPLMEAGHPLVCADLFGQGEMASDGGTVSRNRTVDNPREFAGYSYGYNDTLFAQRVHDILTIIGAMAPDAETISIVGVNGAGPWVAAACAVTGDQVNRIAVDTGGFRFRNLIDYRDANFLPGALKYGDLPALLGLCAPRPLWLGGESVVPELSQRIYAASDAQTKLQLAEETDTSSIVAWILSEIK